MLLSPEADGDEGATGFATTGHTVFGRAVS